jgi:hypothetical protein
MGSGGNSYGSSQGGAGGAVKFVVSGTLTVNGTISANGLSGGYYPPPCGAGGSVWIDCGTLAGSNTIAANGGAIGYPTIGSGGGRVAIYYHMSTFSGLPAPGLHTNLESISSTVTVKGGYNIGSDGPEDGSIYIVHVVPLGTTILFR